MQHSEDSGFMLEMMMYELCQDLYITGSYMSILVTKFKSIISTVILNSPDEINPFHKQ